MNRRAFLLGSAAALVLPAPAAPRSMFPVLGALPDSVMGLPAAVVSDAFGDLVVFGRCVMFVDRQGWRVLDPLKPASADALVLTAAAVPLKTPRTLAEWSRLSASEPQRPV